MRLFDLTETNSTRDWSYLTEGGASIVLSYVGRQHSVCSGKVLRIHKSPAQHLFGPSLSEASDASSDHSQDDQDSAVVFQKLIIAQLLPERYLPDVQSVSVTNEWLCQLAVNIEPFRPAVRRQDFVDTNRKVAALVTDLVGKGLTVEIKPKWGFLPASTHLSLPTLPFKTKYCRFCMHRYYKQPNSLHFENAFCPLDLFSGDGERIRRYLRDLWAAWLSANGKINNLRIFFHGKVIEPAVNLSYESLSKQFLRTERAEISDVGAALVDCLLIQISKTDLFGMVCHLQKTLDPFDIEGLAQLWSFSHPGVAFGSGEPEPTIKEWGDFIHLYRSGEVLTLRHFLLAYLLSATFKDCSVIFSGMGAEEPKISVIDLGPKSIQRLKQWKEQDSNILNHFMQLSESGSKNPCLQ